MKVLLLSCSTGEGHNSAARALMEEFLRCGVECEMADPVSFRSGRAQRLVSSCYNNLIKKTPRAFGAVYKAGALYDSTGITSPVYYANAGYAEELLDYIKDNCVDAVVCTHLFGMEVMTAIEKKLGFNVPSYGVLTDYTCIPFLSETELDGYFVPHETVGQELCDKGVPADKIYPDGIPVSSGFRNRMSKADARDFLGLSQDRRMFLIMTGGVGCENMLKLCEGISTQCGDRAFACVMTGRNDRLYEAVSSRFSDGQGIIPVSFTDKVSVYMNASDVLLSKAGGLSSTEAAVANVPFVTVRPIPGCETKNAEFFERYGMSYRAESDEEAVRLAVSLAFDDESAERMRFAQRENINSDAAADIVRRVIDNA